MTNREQTRRDAEQLIRELSAFAERLPLTMNQDEAGSFSLVVDALLAESASVRALVEALKRISEWQPAVLETLRANGIVFRTALDKPDDERTDAERCEKVAFSIYTDLCEVDTQARAALTVYEQSQGNG